MDDAVNYLCFVIQTPSILLPAKTRLQLPESALSTAESVLLQEELLNVQELTANLQPPEHYPPAESQFELTGPGSVTVTAVTVPVSSSICAQQLQNKTFSAYEYSSSRLQQCAELEDMHLLIDSFKVRPSSESLFAAPSSVQINPSPGVGFDTSLKCINGSWNSSMFSGKVKMYGLPL